LIQEFKKDGDYNTYDHYEKVDKPKNDIQNSDHSSSQNEEEKKEQYQYQQLK